MYSNQSKYKTKEMKYMLNKQTVKKGRTNSAVAGITGAVIGFGIAVAGAAVVLNDKNNRKKVRGVLTNIKGQVMNYMKDVQRKTDKKEKEIEEKLVDSKNETEKLTN